MAAIRADALQSLDEKRYASIIVEGYYEVIKELLTALMCLDGYKTNSHEALIAYLHKFYAEFDDYEIDFMDTLRRIRNKIDYAGFSVNPNFLERNGLEISSIIKRLQDLVRTKLL